MPFNKTEYSKKLDAYQDAISSIRGSRSDGKKIVLEQHTNWRNAVMAVCFGISAAFIAVAPSLRFFSVHREVAYWASAIAFFLIGASVMVYVKNRIETDANELATLMMEAEYYLTSIRNLYRDALRNKIEVDESEIRPLLKKFFDKTHDETQAVIEMSKRILVVDDVWTFFFLASFYLLGAAFVPLHGYGLTWYGALGLVALAASGAYFMRSYSAAKQANASYREWKNKLTIINR